MGSSEKHLVLYVDDERTNRVVFEHSFKSRFNVKCVGSALDALEVLKNETVGVLVTDQRMPGMTGNELLERTKQMYPNVVRIVITAYGDLDPILRAVNDGLVARYIVKPWNRTELEQVLAWGIEAFDLGQQNSVLQLRLMQTERLVTLGSIGAAVIHDINQPLSYMMSNTERLTQLSEAMPALLTLLAQSGSTIAPQDKQTLTDLVAELPEIVRDMTSGCEVMHGLTNSIRRLLRPAADEPQRSIDPVPVIRYALSVCQELAVRARSGLSYQGPAKLKNVRIGSTELTQILINTVANGAQALVRRAQPGGSVVVNVADQGNMLLFTVTDDGPGMSAEVLGRVGTPFFSTRPDGTGLGIAQCRRIIEREGGEFKIESAEGRGTTISFTIHKAPEPLA